MCCVATACPNAVEFVPGAALGQPCPALEWADGRSWCGLVRNPERHSPVFAAMVALGFSTAHEVSAGVAKSNAQGWGCDAGPPPGVDEADEDVGLTALEYAQLVGLGLR